ncbi:MAG: HAMP domain-containing histidine kinase [Thaumarchaeota archaeon]|nr:HAMP domain-containing histidine kinase [Nitrososphaerota archaeon]
MATGALLIIVLFGSFDIRTLEDDQMFSQKDKLIGIGIIFALIHIALMNIVRISFKKMKRAGFLINKQLQALKVIDTAKTEFMAMISHELKTPLVPIVLYTRMLKDERFGKLSDIQKEKTKIVVEAAESLSILVQDILDLQKAELGKLRLNLESSEIKEITDEAIARTILLANRRGVVLQNLIKNKITVMIDINSMIQVLSNLIRNSIDFVPLEDGVIQISLEVDPDHIVIIVRDNGCGIPKDKIENLFKKFYQLDNSTTRERGGTGLGLSICKSIVEGHGGKIWVESEVECGTTMKIQLPILLQVGKNDQMLKNVV